MAGTPRRRPARSSSAKGAARRPRTTRPAGRATSSRTARKRAVTGNNPATGAPRMNPRRWVVLGSLSLLLGVMLVPTAKSWYDQQQQLDELRAQIATQEENVSDLRRERELWSTDEYVEAQARQRLKFVMPGERSYTVVDAEAAEQPGVDPETGAVTAPDSQPWYEQVASSVEAADDPASHK